MPGRIQRQVRRALIAANGEPVPFGELVEWAYAGGRRAWRLPVYRALARWGTNVGRGQWRANDELMARIRGD